MSTNIQNASIVSSTPSNPVTKESTTMSTSIVPTTPSVTPADVAFAPPPPNTATYCERGRVAGVDTTVCEYGDDASLERGVAAVKQEWARLDVHTGVVLRAKRTTMVAVDRERREPSGKTISQMAKLFGKL